MTIAFARQLRRNSTEAEKHLWRHLRNRRLCGAKFRRQVPIGPFVADFVCEDARLIIELDGGYHACQVPKDRYRTSFLEAHRYSVIRFWNNEVLSNIEGVLSMVEAELRSRKR